MTEFGDERLELIELVEQIRSGSLKSQEEEDRAIAEFVSRVPVPRATDLIFHHDLEFDHVPSASEIVDRALTYRALELE